MLCSQSSDPVSTHKYGDGEATSKISQLRASVSDLPNQSQTAQRYAAEYSKTWTVVWQMHCKITATCCVLLWFNRETVKFADELLSAQLYEQTLHNSCCITDSDGQVNIYFTLLLVDLHGVLHLRKRLHVGVAGLPLLPIIFLLVEFLQRDRRESKRTEEEKND